jgi:hypothetical protein
LLRGFSLRQQATFLRRRRRRAFAVVFSGSPAPATLGHVAQIILSGSGV